MVHSKTLLVEMILKNFIQFCGFILIFIVCQVKLQPPTKKLIVLLSGEVDNTSNTSFYLSQPKNIIAGACLASHEFCKYPDCLQLFQVHPLLVLPSDPVKGVPKLLEILLGPAVEVIGVAGVVSDKIEEFYRPLITHIDERIPQKYVNSYLPSHEDTANAFIQILQQLNWTKVTIIQSNYYKYEEIATHIRTSSNATFDFVAMKENTIGPSIQKLKYGETKIFLILAPPHISSSVIHKAIEEGVVWPHYVWVVVLLEPVSLTPSPMWENVLLIMYKSPTLDYSNTTCTEKVSSTSNFYSSLLYDAVQQLLMGFFNTSKKSSAKFSSMKHEHSNGSDDFQPNKHIVKEIQLLLVLYVVRNKTLLELGYYRVTDSSSEFVNLEDLPSDQLLSHNNKLYSQLSVSLCIMIFITYVLAFVNFFLMVAFRKEKEVKASSFALTSVIYMGSCLLMVSATLMMPLLVVTCKIGFICIIAICCFNTGLTILLLTYILKTLRIWRIFSHFGKMSAAWSDSRLLVVVLIGSAVMLTLSIVTTHDLKYNVIRTFRNDTAPPYYEYTPTCYEHTYSRSQTLSILRVIPMGGFVILFILLFILSLKTRNIRRSNFKETKRTNIFIMCFIFVYFLILTLAIGNLKRYVMFFNGLFGVAVSFISQLVIFPPTLYPIFYHYVKQYCCFSY